MITARTRMLLAALAVTASGVVPIAWLATRDAPPATTTVRVVTEADSTVPTPGPVAGVTPPVIPGVSAEVARVLAEQGYAVEEPLEGVSRSVVAVLEANHATLTVPIESGI